MNLNRSHPEFNGLIKQHIQLSERFAAKKVIDNTKDPEMSCNCDKIVN